MYNFISTRMNDNKDQMLEAFRQLDASDPVSGDKLFEDFGPGSSDAATEPFERYHDYELMLLLLKQENADKYEQLHKGTPFFFLGWLAFQMRNYEAANFYLAAAIKEDQRKSNGQPFEVWIENPAGKLVQLKQYGHPADIVVMVTRTFIQNALVNFAVNTSSDLINTDVFVEKFVREFLKQENYALITALYSFVMEFEERYHYLHLTGANIASVDPVIQHLFRGGRIFETIAKHYYPKKDSGGMIDNMGGLPMSREFRRDFPDVKQESMSVPVTSLEEIVATSTNFDTATTFSNIAKIRNLSGHHMLSDEAAMIDIEGYKKLYEQEITAILQLISKQW